MAKLGNTDRSPKGQGLTGERIRGSLPKVRSGRAFGTISGLCLTLHSADKRVNSTRESRGLCDQKMCSRLDPALSSAKIPDSVGPPVPVSDERGE